ncbi:nitronate monooxygenase [Chloroflexota bacterium]
MLQTAICDLFDIKHPILQGGMAHIGTAELVSAVSNSGGLGIIGSGFYEPDWIKEQIHLTRQLTNESFGINIQLASPFSRQVIELVLEEKVSIVTTGAGNPENDIPRFRKAGIKIVPVVNNVDLAIRMEKAGADALIAEGMESGGHIGETTTMALVPQVADSVRIPVVAAGGICDGRGMAAALALGAEGIQMGTRFVCSEECIASDKYKQKILEANDRATVITRQVMGMPQRSLRNNLTDVFQTLEKEGASREELELFDKNRMYLGLIEGDIEDGALLAGQIAGMIKEIKPVRNIMDDIVIEAEMIIINLNRFRKE